MQGRILLFQNLSFLYRSLLTFASHLTIKYQAIYTCIHIYIIPVFIVHLYVFIGRYFYPELSVFYVSRGLNLSLFIPISMATISVTMETIYLSQLTLTLCWRLQDAKMCSILMINKIMKRIPPVVYHSAVVISVYLWQQYRLPLRVLLIALLRSIALSPTEIWSWKKTPVVIICYYIGYMSQS